MIASRNIGALLFMLAAESARTATLELVSSPALAAATPSNGASANVSASADLRYVAYDSTADNLVAGDANRRRDVMLFDRSTGTRTRRIDGAL